MPPKGIVLPLNDRPANVLCQPSESLACPSNGCQRLKTALSYQLSAVSYEQFFPATLSAISRNEAES
jgi:hypothetical protein